MPDPTDLVPPPPLTSAQKSANTLRRRKDERREDKLRHIRAQTADRTLVIRHLDREQHGAAREAARRTQARNDARPRRYIPPDE